jgi:hypothetical protein
MVDTTRRQAAYACQASNAVLASAAQAHKAAFRLLLTHTRRNVLRRRFSQLKKRKSTRNRKGRAGERRTHGGHYEDASSIARIFAAVLENGRSVLSLSLDSGARLPMPARRNRKGRAGERRTHGGHYEDERGRQRRERRYLCRIERSGRLLKSKAQSRAPRRV